MVENGIHSAQCILTYAIYSQNSGKICTIWSTGIFHKLNWQISPHIKTKYIWQNMLYYIWSQNCKIKAHTGHHEDNCVLFEVHFERSCWDVTGQCFHASFLMWADIHWYQLSRIATIMYCLYLMSVTSIYYREFVGCNDGAVVYYVFHRFDTCFKILTL